MTKPDIYTLSFDEVERLSQLHHIFSLADVRAVLVDFASLQAYVHFGRSEVVPKVNAESLPYLLTLTNIEPREGHWPDIFAEEKCSFIFKSPFVDIAADIEILNSEMVPTDMLLGLSIIGENYKLIGVSI